ncbi:MAG: transposase [Chloroflexi bacterium]|nr:transposase [Chloroflexota bacterium]MBU1662722.1 transposase [Chloroflexota bacterium]
MTLINLKRVFEEHFVVTEESNLRPKQGKELSANSLQSPDDEEATYRQKRGEDYVGYVGNLTETCEPENELQLIVKVQVESNTKDDAKMLDEALPELKERTDLDEMHADGGYNSSDVDDTLREQEVDLVQTAIRGAKPSSKSLGLEDFQWEINADGQPQSVTCPQGVTAIVTPGRKENRYLAYFNLPDCEACPFSEQCPTQKLKRKPQRVLRFSQQQVNVARRRQRTAEARASGQNLRAAVEASVRSVTSSRCPSGNILLEMGKCQCGGNPA